MPHDAWMQGVVGIPIINDHLKVELDVTGLQAGDLLLVLVIDIGKDRVFALQKRTLD